MKKIILYIFIIIILFVPVSFAHSGRTDSNGGHYDRSTGEYHYHHGYSAHQHINGICPYNDTSYDDSTGQYSFSDINDELLTDLQAENGNLENEISKLEEKIYDYEYDLEETGFNSIEDLDNKIDELESDISSMWFWFFVIVIASMIIFYNIGLRVADNANNKKQ